MFIKHVDILFDMFTTQNHHALKECLYRSIQLKRVHSNEIVARKYKLNDVCTFDNHCEYYCVNLQCGKYTMLE